ncbi:undecaprenyl-phosphate 4-deoxy-4-formamido-L-arabinose transferase [Dethiosulfatibacter aminovorans DSM 17477]|uniref:Undecaprenyl-phosphate 4-deoxy-4-formamido-L-arabinose transferase n=1 Tax=Dethiosulfatibacter aminovorans DSM 17477 TaxID=1121476 RepID=A0A1M6K3F6_9FIRM|nr:glycosyltransferase family 2 protein [Dethiosulfatibacter aminovorans]SHJ53491.1 undecaprenyl-phosphate 4-deoxy-4-formamido-L-arabinose transferase [Dethiosulfatibacter aminovorans DSM 17477]
MELISFVIPVYNSEKSLDELCKNITSLSYSYGFDYEIILVDDCSTDNSRKAMEMLSCSNPKIISVFLEKNSGQQNAIFCGLGLSRGSLVVNMDDDLQHPIDVVPKLIDEIKKGFDIVYGITDVRYDENYRNFGSKLTDRLFTYILKKPRDKRISSFRIIRRTTVDSILLDNYRYVYISAAVVKHSHKIGNIFYRKACRKHGKSNYNFKKQLIIFFRIIVYYSNFSFLEIFRKRGRQYKIKKIINR